MNLFNLNDDSFRDTVFALVDIPKYLGVERSETPMYTPHTEDSFLNDLNTVAARRLEAIQNPKIPSFLTDQITVPESTNTTVSTEESVERSASPVLTSSILLPVKETAPTNRIQYLMTRLLKELGLTKALAAGIAGNIKIESNFNPKAVGDNGRALGIGLWHSGRRKGIDMYHTSYEDLVSHLINELKSESTWIRKYNGLNRLRLAKTASEAAKMIDSWFERSNGKHLRKRQYWAEQYAKLQRLGGKINVIFRN